MDNTTQGNASTSGTTGPSQCGLCGRTSRDAGPLVEGKARPPVHICIDCSRDSTRILEQQARRRQTREKKLTTIPAPRDIVRHLDSAVIGQHDAKCKLAIAVTSHFKRITDLEEQRDRKAGRQAHPIVADSELADVVLEKSNVLLVGHSGTGKTLLARSLAEKLNVPFAVGDATTLTEAGYVGEDVESLLLKLLRAADFDLEAAERGVIYLDEIDKLQRTGGNVSIARDVAGEGVQQALLKMIEGSVCNIPPQGGRKHPHQQFIQMDTTHVLFICGGAFTGLDFLVSRRIGRGAVGFGQVGRDRVRVSENLLRQVTAKDLMEYGLIPELIGRLPVVATLEELSVDDLVRVLTKPRDGLLKQYRKLLRYDNVELEFTEGAIRAIAALAKLRGTGARGLRSVVEGLMQEILIEPRPGRRYVFTEEMVRGEKPLAAHRIVASVPAADACPVMRRKQTPVRACRPPTPVNRFKNWRDHILSAIDAPEGVRVTFEAWGQFVAEGFLQDLRAQIEPESNRYLRVRLGKKAIDPLPKAGGRGSARNPKARNPVTDPLPSWDLAVRALEEAAADLDN